MKDSRKRIPPSIAEDLSVADGICPLTAIEMTEPATKTTEATPVKRDRSTKQVEKAYVAERGIGRVYKETSGRFVSQARRTPRGARTGRRFDLVKDAKADFVLAVEAHPTKS